MIKKITALLNWSLGIGKPPGYEVLIKVADIDIAVLDRVKEIISHNGFIFVLDKESPMHRGITISEFKRKKKYLIDIALHHSKVEYPERRSALSIAITNYWNGNDPELKTEIDNLGESLRAELSLFTGKERVIMSSHRTELPTA